MWWLCWLLYLHLAPSHWAQFDETASPCSTAGGALLYTEPRSFSMSLDTDLRTAEKRETLCSGHMIFCADCLFFLAKIHESGSGCSHLEH